MLTSDEMEVAVFSLDNYMTGMMLVFLYLNLRDLQDFMLVILMLLIKFVL
jgi:hypothetical protein